MMHAAAQKSNAIVLTPHATTPRRSEDCVGQPAAACRRRTPAQAGSDAATATLPRDAATATRPT